MIFLLCLFPHIPSVTLPGLLFPFKSWEMEEQGKVEWDDRGPRTIPNASLGRSLSVVVLWLLLVKNNSISSTLLENYRMIKMSLSRPEKGCQERKRKGKSSYFPTESILKTGGWGRTKRVKGVKYVHGDGRRLDLGSVSTQWNMQMMHYKSVH